MRKNKSGARNVYQLSSGKWYAKVRKAGKTYKSLPVDHFEQAKLAAAQLRRELNV